MYIPGHFRFDDKEAQLEFIRRYSFGDLITTTDGRLEINHAPFLVDESGKYLLAHFARNNQHWRLVEQADDLKVCFKGPNAYISPNWYTHNKNVPTWNFVSVQVSGKASLMEDAELVELLDKLSQKHEAQFANPWKIEKLSEKQLNAMVRAIVGVKISIDEIEGKAKLSQNKSKDDFDSLLNGLSRQKDSDSQAVMSLMQQLDRN